MDNISKLLLEAAELLNEGARNRKEFKDEDGNSSYSCGRRAAKKLAKIDDDGDATDAAYDILRGMAIKNDNMIEMRNKDKKHIYAKKILNGKLSEKDIKAYNRLMDSEFLHKKINDRSITQNESIAVLLTEAAELLSEGIFFNKKEKSSDIDYEKIAKDKLNSFKENNKDLIKYMEDTNKKLSSIKTVNNVQIDNIMINQLCFDNITKSNMDKFYKDVIDFIKNIKYNINKIKENSDLKHKIENQGIDIKKLTDSKIHIEFNISLYSFECNLTRNLLWSFKLSNGKITTIDYIEVD